MRRRTLVLAGSALALAVVAVREPSADIRILTHDASDLAPHRVQAAVDLGLVAVSVLVTWTSGRLSAR